MDGKRRIRCDGQKTVSQRQYAKKTKAISKTKTYIELRGQQLADESSGQHRIGVFRVARQVVVVVVTELNEPWVRLDGLGEHDR